jgi:hypothetical protein
MRKLLWGLAGFIVVVLALVCTENLIRVDEVTESH